MNNSLLVKKEIKSARARIRRKISEYDTALRNSITMKGIINNKHAAELEDCIKQLWNKYDELGNSLNSYNFYTNEHGILIDKRGE